MSTYTDASLIVTPNAKKAGKLYALKGADLDVVRATTATYVGSDGLIKTAGINEVRFDYTNGSCPSILVEPQRTNLVLQSDMFANTTWVKDSSSISPNDQISPDGTLTADTYIGNGLNLPHFMYQHLSVTSGIAYSISVYAKKGTNDFIQLCGSNAAFGVNCFANFNISNGTIGTIGSATIASIDSVGNGWYRLKITSTAIATTSIAPILIILIGSSTSVKIETNSLSTSVHLWGAQLEVGSNVTSYIPTTTTEVTRNADVISKSGLTGINTITETFEDDTTNVISGSPTSYTMSEGKIKNVIGL